jgi:hypothetical protein
VARSDRNWILDGATVHVSIIGFDSGEETTRVLDERPVKTITSDLDADRTAVDASIRSQIRG